MTTEAIVRCDIEDCTIEGVYCVTLANSNSASNLSIICGEHLGMVVAGIADRGKDVYVYRP